MVNRTAADELRDACMSVALELGGWEDEPPLENGTRKPSQRSGTAVLRRNRREVASRVGV